MYEYGIRAIFLANYHHADCLPIDFDGLHVCVLFSYFIWMAKKNDFELTNVKSINHIGPSKSHIEYTLLSIRSLVPQNHKNRYALQSIE